MVSQNLEKALSILEKAPRSVKKLTRGIRFYRFEGDSDDYYTGTNGGKVVAMCSVGFVALQLGATPVDNSRVRYNGAVMWVHDFLRKNMHLSLEEVDSIILANARRSTFKGVVNLVRKANGESYKVEQSKSTARARIGSLA